MKTKRMVLMMGATVAFISAFVWWRYSKTTDKEPLAITFVGTTNTAWGPKVTGIMFAVTNQSSRRFKLLSAQVRSDKYGLAVANFGGRPGSTNYSWPMPPHDFLNPQQGIVVVVDYPVDHYTAWRFSINTLPDPHFSKFENWRWNVSRKMPNGSLARMIRPKTPKNAPSLGPAMFRDKVAAQKTSG